MAEFEPNPRRLIPQQSGALSTIISRVQVPEDSKIDPLTGCFPVIDPRTNQELTIFHPNLIGSEGNQLYKAQGRIRIRYQTTYRTGNSRMESTALINDKLRVVDPDYSGVYQVGDSGWVLLNIVDPKTRQKLLTDDLYEERLQRAYQGLNPNIESDAPCILVHPDYRGSLQEVRVVSFDPLVESFDTGHRFIRPLLDAVLIGEDGKFIPKMVTRLLSLDQWRKS